MLDNVKININHILVILLVIIIGILYFENRNFKKVLYSQNTSMIHYMNEFNDRMNDRMNIINRNKDIFYNDFNNLDNSYRRIEKDMDNYFRREISSIRKDFLNLNNEFKKIKNFNYSSKVKIDNEKFELNLKLSKKINKNDVKIDFKNKNLNIKIGNDFSENYFVSETKATIKDVKFSVDNGELKVVIPIIK